MAGFLYTLIIYPLILIIEFAFMFCNAVFKNPGISVIGVSFAVSLLCLPLYVVAEHWQQVERDTEKKLEPGINRIKKTFSGDEQYMILSTYYRQHMYHPIMALRSSFGLLIQIPFFIAAYIFLSKLPVLKGRSFLFIRDMGAPDALFRIGSFPVNVLPVAMTIINIIAGAVYTKGFKVKEKIQIYGMALVFLVLLYTSPSGLVLYWTMNNIFSLVKNVFYKFRSPLKIFWGCTCAFCSFALIYFVFFTKLKKIYCAAFLIFTVFIFIIPLVLKFLKKLLNTSLAFISAEGRMRFLIFAAGCVCLFLLSGAAIPTSLISSSPLEFAGIGSSPNPLSLVYNPFVQALGFWVLWPLCIYFLFNNKIQTFFTIILCDAALCAVINTFCFSLSYGDISQTLMFSNASNLSAPKFTTLCNTAVLITVTLCCLFFIGIRRGKIFSSLLIISSIALAGISTANTVSISKKYAVYESQLASDRSMPGSLVPILHLSKTGRNVILFMVDRAQNQYIPEIFKEASDVSDAFTGFVYYPNTVSFNGHTLMGAPGLYGGYEYIPEEMNKRKNVPLVEKNNEALLLLPRIFSEQLGYDAAVTDPSWANYSTYPDLRIFDRYPRIKAYHTIGKYTGEWYIEHPEYNFANTTEAELKRNLIIFSLFRSTPVFLRKVIYKDGTYWNSDKTVQNKNLVYNNYAVLDLLPRLTDFTGSGTGTYTCIVNELTHEPSFFQAPDYVPAQNITDYGSSKYAHQPYYHSNIAAFKLIAKWIQLLKKNGVYDNTRIIFVADHGSDDKEDCMEKDDALDAQITGGQYHGRGHYHPLLFFKDFNSEGPVKTDNSFMTNVDVSSLLLKGLIAHPVNPFTEKEIPLDTTPFKKNGVTITSSDQHQPAYNGTYTFSIKESEWWTVKDNIFKAENWKRASKPVE
ncbi:MAG: YidC/Oxa1 family membrane protein insertase [Treponema sp.]|nr:YidC/Oxa1 family membrane protein insertase [Treponema sp.]